MTLLRKKKSVEEAIADEVMNDEVDLSDEADELIGVGEPDEPEDVEGEEEEEEEESPWSIEALDEDGRWNRRLGRLDDVIDQRLWKARAVGGDQDVVLPKGKRDLSYIELVDKAESAFIELKCALVNTVDAPKVIVRATNQLRALRQRVGTRAYPRAILGMIQSCLHEQKMGFHTVPGSMWDFDEEEVNERYRMALQGITTIEEVLVTVKKAEAEEGEDGSST